VRPVRVRHRNLEGSTAPRAAAAPAPARWPATAREVWDELLAGFKANDLLTYASAISFQVLTAIIPFLLFVLAAAGVLHLGNVWNDHMAPQIEANTSHALFRVISDGVDKVFAGNQLAWVSFGGVLALWQVSGAVRAVMGAFDNIYGAEERPFVHRYAISFALSIAVGALFLLAAGCLLFGPFFSTTQLGPVSGLMVFVSKWALGTACLALAVGLLVHVAPAMRQPLPWVSLGTAIVIVSWVLVSLGFYAYLTSIAAYDSVFGSLASVIVLMGYLYLSTIVFLFGAQLDAIIRERATGTACGTGDSGH
jgi:membrane protein